MRIALIQCPLWTTMSPPYSLALLSACLKEAGHEVFCHDFNIMLYHFSQQHQEDSRWQFLETTISWYSTESVLEIIKRYETYIDTLVEHVLENDPKVIGFSITFVSRIFSEEIAKKIKKKNPNVTVIFGGFMCFRCEFGIKILESTYVDAVCFLEGEAALINLLEAIEANGGRLTGCSGFGYRTSEGEVIDCGDYPLIDDLNSIPYADFSGFNFNDYTEKTLPIAASRGCVNRCSFCAESVILKKYRSRDAHNVFQEMIFQLQRHPEITMFYFNDSLLNGNMPMLEQLCDLLIGNGLNVKWGGNLTVSDKLTAQFLEKMRKAGFCLAGLGLESASPALLKKMRKGFSIETATEMLKNMHEAGIRVHVNFLVGFPGETEEDIYLTEEFLSRTKDYLEQINFHPYVVLPKTLVDENRASYGVIIPENGDKIRWHSIDNNNTFEIRQQRLELYRKKFGQKTRLQKL